MSGTRACSNCGTVVQSDAGFCPKCGTQVAGADGSAAPPDPDATQQLDPSQLAATRKLTAAQDAAAQQPTVQSDLSQDMIAAQRLAQAAEGEFEILERLGYGAMGSVYLARDLALSRRVAIKVVSPALLLDDKMIARFRLEAQTVASLRHPNIVNVYAVRQHSDLHFFVMDYIDGPSLRSILKTHGALDVPVAQALLFEVGSALSYAHRRGRGVIHRDIKPANIMVDREGHAVVMDFGISKVGASTGLTQTGTTIGTPDYMSPEQCRDKELTGASDQYALGIVAYEMLTGQTPFKGSIYEVMVAHANEEPAPIRDRRPDCPQAVEDAIMRMLRKKPEERWPDLDAAVVGLGGRPLAPRDPVRTMVIELAESVVGATDLGLDAGSPLSPLPGPGKGTEGVVAVNISGLPGTVEEGDTFRLRAEIRGASGSLLTLSDLVWSTSDPSVVTVQDGTVQAHGTGSASVTATAGTVASTVIVNVTPPTASRISILPSSVRIQAGGRMEVTAKVLDRRGAAVGRTVRWMSEADHFVSVADKGPNTGELVALAPGATKITAEVDGITAAAEVIVEGAEGGRVAVEEAPDRQQSERSEAPTPRRPRPDPARRRARRRRRRVAVAVIVVAAVAVAQQLDPGFPSDGREVPVLTLRPVSDTLEMSDSLRLVASGGGEAVDSVQDAAPIWTSSDTAVATVDPDGLVIAHAAGRVTIRALLGGVEGAARLVVLDSAAVAMLDGALDTALVEETLPPPSVAEETSPAPTVAEETDPLPTAPDLGVEAIPRERSRTLVGTVDVQVTTTTMRVGSGQAPTARVLNLTGGRIPPGDYRVTWHSTDPSVLRVDRGGPMVALSPGYAHVVATVVAARDTVQDSVRVAVAVVPAEVRIDGGDLTVQAGDTAQLRATVIDPEGRSFSLGGIRWTSSDDGVASVGAGSGRLQAHRAGVVTVVAAIGTVEGTVTVTVEPPPPAAEPPPPAVDSARSADSVPSLPSAPSAEEARAEAERYVGMLAGGDADAVRALFGGAADEERHGTLLDRLDERSFEAALVDVGELAVTGSGSTVTFRVRMTWRGFSGAGRESTVEFHATLVPTEAGWSLSACVLAPGAQP